MNFPALHKYYNSLGMDSHLEHVKNKGQEVNLSSGFVLTPEVGYIYFVVEGVISLSMAGSKRIIGNIVENMPIGLMERYCPLVDFRYICGGDVKMIKISWEDFDDIFILTNPTHTIELSTILTYMVIFSLDLNFESKQATSYQIIKPMLSRYLYRKETSENEGLASFILRRTNISRTHVFRVLAVLKEGEYITMNDGKLISINKDLPKFY